MAYGGSTNPTLLAAIRRLNAPPELKATLLATTWAESGGRLDAVGDNGQSFGPYQEYSQGRGAGIAPADRQDPVASTARAYKEFNKYWGQGLRGGELAFSAQRPANRGAYVAKINSYLDEARKLIGGGPAGPVGNPASPATAGAQKESPQSGYGLGATVAQSLLQRRSGESLFKSVMAGVLNQQLTKQLQGDPQATGDAAQRRQHKDDGGPLPPPGAVKFRAGGGPEAHGTRALGNWQSDNAYDIMGRTDDPVYIPVSGVVTKISGQPGGDPGFAGYGVTVRTPEGDLFFKHLGTSKVKVGQRLSPGTLVGTLDAKTAGGPHLHLGGTDRSLLDRLNKWYLGNR